MTEAVLGLVETSTWLAALGAFLWGIASIVLSPCHLASIPLLVGFLRRLHGQSLSEKGISFWVTIGASASLVVVAAVSLWAGRILGDLWGIGPWITILFLVVAALVLLGAVELPSIGQLRPKRAQPGAPGAIVAGGILGGSLGPCTFAFFAPLFAFGPGSASPALKVVTIGAFVVAHLLATFAAGVLGARLGDWFSQGRRVGKIAKYVVGLAALGVAVEMIINAP